MTGKWNIRKRMRIACQFLCEYSAARIIIIIIIIQKSLYTVAYSVTYQYFNYLQNWFSKGRVLKAKILIN